MAIFHLNGLIISRSGGSSSVASAAYRSGEKIRDEKTRITHDYTRKQGVLHTEIITPKNVPDWASNRHQLWNAVEASEKRKDAQLAREIMVALPYELNEAQCIELIRGFSIDQFIKKGMIADFAIHAPGKNGDERNCHSHILLTTRKITPEGFGNKAREWNAKANIYQWRKAWEQHTNQALKQAGLECQIDSRSHAKKGLDQEPRLHLGVHATALERKGIPSDRGNENRAIESRNDMREKLRYELDEINGELDKLQQGKSEEKEGIKTPETVMNSTEIIHAVLDLAHDNQQQTTLPINEIQLSANNTLNADKDNSLDTQKIQNDLSLNQPGNLQETIKHKEEPSFEERKKSLEQKAEAFKERQEKLKLQIENITDEKTQARLRLEEKLVSSDFIRTDRKELAGILAEEDAKKNAYDIAILKHEAKNADQKYKECADEWNYRAVRDNGYKPIDTKSADKVDKMKKAIMEKKSEFEDKAKKNEWSEDRYEQERKKLQEEMDRQIAYDFDLKTNRSRDRGMGR